MIFGSQRDFALFTGINRELLSDVIEQEILFYKVSLEQTQANIYGEAMEKVFWSPIKYNCLVQRGDQRSAVDDLGVDIVREVKFNLLRQDLLDTNVEPEIGDIVMWLENYYEIDNITENQLFLGKDNAYSLTQYGNNFGASVSLIFECHLTRADKVGITRQRL
jgi:hypothetical protein